MKKIIFIIAINFFISNCFAEDPPFNALSAFLSIFGVSLKRSPSQYEKLRSDSNPNADAEYDPLDVLIVKLNGKFVSGTIGNLLLVGQVIRGDEFVDVLLACPKNDERPLAIENNYISIVKKNINQANKLLEETNRQKEDENNTSEHEITKNINSTNSDQDQKNPENVPQVTAIELDSDQQKNTASDAQNFLQGDQSVKQGMQIPEENNEGLNSSPKEINKRKNSTEFIATGYDTDHKKNKVDSVDVQDDNKNKAGSVDGEMEIDSVSIQETDKTNLNGNTTPDSQSETKKDTAPIQKINEDVNSLTPENEKFWIQALKEMQNVKCRKPITAHLMEYPSKSKFRFYIGGFEIIMDMHEDLEIPEFKKTSNRKYRWFWSFTIVFTEPDRNVVCVYQEIQYNKDTYSPQINDDFSNHDLGNDMMFSGMNISELYEIDNQEKVFVKLFKDENERKKYFDLAQEKFLVRVHLAPLNGFVSSVTRQFGKSYGNVAAMWNSIRNGAWRRVEEYVNILSHVLVDIIVVTGTYGILNLDEKNVHLADEKVPVPLAFWKLVAYGTELDNLHGILIITSNNPYKDIGDIICNVNKCMRFGWGHIQEEDITKGRTICCDFHPEILEHIPILIGLQPPEILNLTKIRPFVETAWAFNEMGEGTTLEQRNAIWDKLQLNNDAFNEELNATNATNEEVEENLKRRSENEKVSQINSELQAVPLIQRHTVF